MIKKKTTPRLGAEVSQLSVPFSVRATQKVSTHYIVDLWDTLENLSDVEELLFVLGIAEKQDQITIHLNCQGGSAYVGDAIMLAMNNCEAEIHVQASGTVASFATFILLNCDSFEISPFCQILCHSASYGSYGKMTESKQYSDFSYSQCEKMLHHYYEGFLTQEELDRIINQGFEHWMTSEDFVERFKNMVEYREKQMREAFNEAQSEEPCNCSCGQDCSCTEED